MPLVLAGATSGSTTLQATDATTQTITLPANSGTVITTAASQTLTTPNVVGPLTMTSGGITFNANPGGGTQATLNDYETGTWTPSVTGVTIGTATGIYIKIGKLVFIGMAIPVTSGTNTGMTITNLPYTSWNGNRQVLFARENASTGKTGQLYIDSNSTSGSIQDYAGTSGGTNGYTWIITGTYQASA